VPREANTIGASVTFPEIERAWLAAIACSVIAVADVAAT